MVPLSRPISPSTVDHFPFSPRLWWPSSFFRHLFSNTKKVGLPSPAAMTLCLSSPDFIVMKVLVRIWFHDVHSAMGHGPWLQRFDDLIYHSRIMLCQAWELGRFRNCNLQSIECHCTLKGYSLWCVITLHNLTFWGCNWSIIVESWFIIVKV